MSYQSRSGVIRKAIAPVNSRLLTLMNEADGLVALQLPTEHLSCLSRIDDLEELRAKIQSSIGTLQDRDKQWLDLIMLLESEDVDSEENIYQHTAFEQSGGFLNTIEQSKETCCSIDRSKIILRRQAERLSDSGRPSDASSFSFGGSAKLPKLSLPTFGGDQTEWLNFWSIYKTNIHDRSLAATDKFSYLHGLLTGPARTCIDGLSLTEENYRIAISILKERYERTPTQLVGALYSRLKRIPASSTQLAELLRTFDNCEKIFRQLTEANEDIDNNRSLVLELLSKYPSETVKELMSHKCIGPESTLKDVREALHQHIKQTTNFESILEDLQPFGSKAAHGFPTEKPASFRSATNVKYSHGTSSALVSHSQNKQRSNSPTNPCYFCSGHHFNSRCDQYQSVEERHQRLRDLKRCCKCLSARHTEASCQFPTARLRCFFCKSTGAHISPLCPKEFYKPANASTSLASPALLNASERAYLMTARTSACNISSGITTDARVIFDTGSHRTYVTESFVRKLGLTSLQDEYLEVAVFGTNRTLSVPSQQVHFALKLVDGTNKEIQAHATPVITSCPIIPASLPECDLRAMRDFNMDVSDKPSSPQGPIDVLIGADYFWEFVAGNRIILPSGLYVIPSSLGAVIGGRCGSNLESKQSTQTSLLCLTETCCRLPAEYGLVATETRHYTKSPDIDDYWRLEKIGITDDPIANDDDKAIEQFNTTVYFSEGRYHVTWPWKENCAALPVNYELALGRFKNLTKRLLQNTPEILDEYAKVINDQMNKGVIERVPDTKKCISSSISPMVHYLPHHPVLKPCSTTTKIRIVYDASAKTRKDNPSLNECMFRGPVILPDLCSVLLRFRMNAVGLVADIEKAFLQLSLQVRDRDVTRFLWFKDPKNLEVDDNIATYRFCRVPFGIVSSPFLLNATVQYHLKQQKNWIADCIMSNIYVDNVITGVSNPELGKEFYQGAKETFASAGMNLQEWGSNSKELCAHIPQHDLAKREVVKVLGMVWDLKDDSLRLQSSDVVGNTKRSVLQSIASVYDPLGLFQPTLLRAKLFLKTLWEKGKPWDERLDDESMNEWNDVKRDFVSVTEICIPRCPAVLEDNSELTIATFCDASSTSYGAVVYVRIRSGHHDWSSNIVFSKSRLAPRNRSNSDVSLPRLELLGVLIGVRATLFVKKSLRLRNDSCTSVCIFTDSTCVLHWLKSSKPLSVFVENRVREINAAGFDIRYVASNNNPADLNTRGLAAENLCPFWWKGPTWLSVDSDKWPVFKCSHQLPLDGVHTEVIIWNKSSNARDQTSPITKSIFDSVSIQPRINSNDLNAAKRVWILHMQNLHYGSVKKALVTGRAHPLIKQLGLVADHNNIIRCRGRLEHAELEFQAREPILLAKNDDVCNLIISDVHERLLHSGVGHTLSQLRRLYWIPQGRAAVRKVITRCRLCRKYKGAPFALPPMPPLPRERISKSHPFEFTGLDYFGPVNVRVEESVKKMWVCLFTCLAVRAIHLEFVPDCSAREFLQCLIRFISRRGTPSQIISDNAPQFRVTKTVIDRVWHEILIDESIQSYTAKNGIQWTFTTELAPWQGGFYERLVGIVKGAFRCAVGRRLLPWYEFITVLSEVEAVVNCRPLTYAYCDFPSGQCLRPIDFLTELPVAVPVTDPSTRPTGFGDAGRDLVKAWKIKQGKLHSMWEFWRNEYLQSLRERFQRDHKHHKGEISSFPQPDNVVLIRDTDIPRGCWKIGRVVNLVRSSDNRIRSAEVQLASGVSIKRAINFLYPLEIGDCASDDVGNKSIANEDEDFQGFTEKEVEDTVKRMESSRGGAAVKARIHQCLSDVATKAQFTRRSSCGSTCQVEDQ